MQQVCPFALGTVIAQVMLPLFAFELWGSQDGKGSYLRTHFGDPKTNTMPSWDPQGREGSIWLHNTCHPRKER